MNENQTNLTINDLWKEKNSKREKWTETVTNETTASWLVENGNKIKKLSENHSSNSYARKELISEAK